MMIPNMCLVLKLDNGKVVSIADEQTDRRTKQPSTVLVYRYIIHKIYTLLDLAPPKQNFWVRQWSCCVWVLRPFKIAVLDTQKFNFLQKLPNLQGKLELIWCSFVTCMAFFVWFLVFEIWSILYLFLKDVAEIWRHFFFRHGRFRNANQ